MSNELTFDQLTEKKPISSYPKSILNDIKILSVWKSDPAQLFGSTSSRLQKYPADVDLEEDRLEHGDKKVIVKHFIHELQNVVKRILKTPDHYYSETKLGVDDRYIVRFINKPNNGIWQPDEEGIDHLVALNDQGLFDPQDWKIIYNALREPNVNAYDAIKVILRKYWILRWSVAEILSGKKKLRNNKVVSMEELLMNYKLRRNICKIDMITLINGKFMEISNIIFLAYENNRHQKYDILYQPQNDEFIHDIKVDIESFYYDDQHYNPFKAVKRMFTLCSALRTPEAENFAFKISGLLDGNVAMLYQIKAQLEAIQLLLARLKIPPLFQINKQIGDIKFILPNFLGFTVSDLNIINDILDKIIDSRNIVYKLNNIQRIINLFEKFINYYTIEFMDNNGINPPPEFVLSEPGCYYNSRDVVRKPDDNPIKPTEYYKKRHRNKATGAGYRHYEIMPEHNNLAAQKRARQIILNY